MASQPPVSWLSHRWRHNSLIEWSRWWASYTGSDWNADWLTQFSARMASPHFYQRSLGDIYILLNLSNQHFLLEDTQIEILKRLCQVRALKFKISNFKVHCGRFCIVRGRTRSIQKAVLDHCRLSLEIESTCFHFMWEGGLMQSPVSHVFGTVSKVYHVFKNLNCSFYLEFHFTSFSTHHKGLFLQIRIEIIFYEA